MVFRRDTLRNTKTFNQINKTSSVTSNINTASIKQNIPKPAPISSKPISRPRHNRISNRYENKQVSATIAPFDPNNTENYADQTVRDLPSSLKQAVNDDRLISSPSWTDKLFAAIPSVQFQEAYADTDERHDTNAALINSQKFTDKEGNYDMKSAAADSGSEKIHPVNKQPSWIDSAVTGFYTWRDENFSILPTSTKYEGKPAAGAETESYDSTRDFEGAPLKELQPVDLSSTDKGYTNHVWLRKLQGTSPGTTPKSGSTEFEIKNYVEKTTSTSNYSLPSDVSVYAHQNALNKQQTAKFENSIQSQYVRMLHGSGGPDADDYTDLQTQIKKSNLSDKKKDALLDQYAIKSQNYSNLMTGNASNYQNRKLTVAEKLQSKRDSGEGLTPSEQKKLDTLTGKFSKATNNDDDFGQYSFDVMKSNYLDVNPGATGLPKQTGGIMGWDDVASSSYKKGTVKPYSTQNPMDHYDYFA